MPKKPKNLSTRISVPSLFVCLLSPAAYRLKKREPGIGETLDNSHYAFEKRSLGGKNPPTRAVKLHANFMKSYALLTQRLSRCCQSVVVTLSLGGSAQADQRVGGSGPPRLQQSLSIAYAIVRRGLLVGVADTVAGGRRFRVPGVPPTLQ